MICFICIFVYSREVVFINFILIKLIIIKLDYLGVYILCKKILLNVVFKDVMLYGVFINW